MWGYLSEFWDSITQVTLNAWEYTTEWFQNVGNAVAGAIGQLFYSTLHYLNDTWVFLGWIFSVISSLISLFLLPLTYIFNFLKGLLSSIFSTPTDFPYTWDAGILAVFNAIPYWSTISVVLGLCISIIIIFFVLKAFARL
jgi:uncharacterized membrane protein